MALPTQTFPINKFPLTSLVGFETYQAFGWNIDSSGSAAYHDESAGYNQLPLPAAQGGGPFYTLGYAPPESQNVSGMSYIECKLAICDGVGMGMSMGKSLTISQGIYFGIFANPDGTGFYGKIWFGSSRNGSGTWNGLGKKRSIRFTEKKLPKWMVEGNYYNFNFLPTMNGWIVGHQKRNPDGTLSNTSFVPFLEIERFTTYLTDEAGYAISPSTLVHGAWATNGLTKNGLGKIGGIKVYAWPRIGYPYAETIYFYDSFNRTSSTYSPSQANTPPSKWSTVYTSNNQISTNGQYCTIGSSAGEQILLTGYTEIPQTSDGCAGPDGTGSRLQWKHISGSYGFRVDLSTRALVNTTSSGSDRVLLSSDSVDNKGGTTTYTAVGAYSVSSYPYIRMQIEFYLPFSPDLVIPNTSPFQLVSSYAKRHVLYQSQDGVTWFQSAIIDNNGEEAAYKDFYFSHPSDSTFTTGSFDDLYIVRFPSYDSLYNGYPMQSYNAQYLQVDTQIQLSGRTISYSAIKPADTYLGFDKAYGRVEAG